MPVIIEKYKFYTKKTDFVGFIIKLEQISMDLKKIKTIINCHSAAMKQTK